MDRAPVARAAGASVIWARLRWLAVAVGSVGRGGPGRRKAVIGRSVNRECTSGVDDIRRSLQESDLLHLVDALRLHHDEVDARCDSITVLAAAPP